MTLAIVDTELCTPSGCPEGWCAVRQVCPTRAIYQMEAHETPATDPERCRGCARCARSCPRRAIRMV